eukprot:6873513-Prymnesium_polylepis.1
MLGTTCTLKIPEHTTCSSLVTFGAPPACSSGGRVASVHGGTLVLGNGRMVSSSSSAPSRTPSQHIARFVHAATLSVSSTP